MKSVLSSAAVAAASIAIVACGGDEITEVTEQYTSGAKILKAEEPMPACTILNEGDMVYSTDSSKLYFCSEKMWHSLNGARGEAGDACKAERVVNKDSSNFGIAISCGDFLDTLWNGEKGEKGDTPEGCTILPAVDSTNKAGLEVKCGESKPIYIWNDEEGEAGCKAEATTDKKTKKTGVKITCGNSEPVYVWDGENVVASARETSDKSSSSKTEKSGDDDPDPATSTSNPEPKKDDSSSSSEEVTTEPETSSENSSSSAAPLCGEVSYDSETQFCDSRDNTIYSFVVLGTQKWMAENLNYDYKNPECLANSPKCLADNSECLADNLECLADNICANNTKGCATYGRLYAWYTAQTICPEGWSLPARKDVETLMTYANSKSSGSCNISAGTCTKAFSKTLRATTSWKTAGSNTLGMNIFMTGYGVKETGEIKLDIIHQNSAAFWLSNSQASAEGWYFDVDMNGLLFDHYDKEGSLAIRCIQNIEVDE